MLSSRWMFAGLRALDCATTLFGLSRGAVEVNPVQSFFLRWGSGAFLAEQAVLVALILLAVNLRQPTSRRILVLANLMQLVVLLNNIGWMIWRRS